MKEVARVAGVSLATVSRVINGTGEVRPDLAGRVQDAVNTLGYRRDVTASTLRRADRQSASIGLIIEDVSNPFFSAVHRGVEDVARAHGVLTFVGSSDENEQRERELADAFAARGVDGLVIVPCAGDQSYLKRDHQAGIALVFVDRPPQFLRGDAVVSDNRGGGRAAVEHLIGAGHRRIAFLGDRASIFTAQNLVTIGATLALRTLSRQHDVAVVGFDDVTLGDLVKPGLTVIAQDPFALGRQAGELLFARLQGQTSDARTVVVPTQLITRGSGEIRPSTATPELAR